VKTREGLRANMYGEWRDTYVYRNGEKVATDWRCNQIQIDACTLIVGLLTRLFSTDAEYTGISYFAVGSGDVTWDITPPTKDPEQTTLETETFRKPINTLDMVFLEEDGETVSATPTNKFLVRCELDYEEANGDLREFGLFGGYAIATANTGTHVNWISHSLISKTSDFKLLRDLRITVELGA